MGVLTRRLIKQNLDQVDVFMHDSTNDFFVVQDLPQTFTQGRNTFKIFGSKFLKDNVPLKFEILDKLGNTVYIEPIDYGQSKANTTGLNIPYRYVTVEVYRPPINVPGAAKLVILAELNPDTVHFNIPKEYRGTYNVKYNTTINIDSTEPINKSPVLFYRRPKFTVQEIVKAQLVKPELVTSEVSGTFVQGFATNEGDTYELPSDTTGSTDSTSTYESFNSTDTTDKMEERRLTELYKYKSGEQKIPSLLGKKGTVETRLSPQPPEFKVSAHSFTPSPPFTGSFTSRMVGGEIRIPKESIYVSNADNLNFDSYTGIKSGFLSDFTTSHISWNDYTGSIEKVENDRIVHCRQPFYVIYQPPAVTAKKQIRKASFGNPYVPANRTGLANFTASFQDLAAPSTSSYRFDSFIDLDLTNLRTFSGDVYRLRVSGKSQSEQSDFRVLLDTVIESPELLVDSNSSSGVLRTGYFQSQAHTDLYWASSSNTTVTYNTNYLSDSIYISGSHSEYQDALRVNLKTDNSFTLLKGVPYTLTFEAYGKQTDKKDLDGNIDKEGRLFFHVSGSRIAADNDLNVTEASIFGQTLTDLTNRKVGIELDESAQNKFLSLGRVQHTFVPKFTSNSETSDNTATFQIRANSGEWYISDVSIRPAQDTGFSPDTFSTRIPIPNNTSRPDRYDFYVEYFNINNDSAQQTTLIEDVPIIGAPLILEGSDNMLTGSLFIGSLQGTGIEMHGGSAFVRAVGYQGFKSASAGQGGGFMIWSGSVKPGGETQDDYDGAGLEIHDGNTGVSESFFKFRTKDAENVLGGVRQSTFDIKTSRFFLGQSTTQFVSGSNGNLEISSSNFHLEPDGDVTMQGTITAEAGGTIGGWDITSDAISDLNASGKGIEIKSDPSSPTITIKEDSNNKIELYHTTTNNFGVKGVSGSNTVFQLGSTNQIAGWNFNSSYMSKALSGHSETATSRIYLSVANDDAQNIQQGLHIYRDDDDTTNGDVKVVRVGGLSDITNLHATGSNDFGIQVIKKNSNNNYSNLVYIGKTQQQIAGWNITPSTIESNNLIIDNSGELRSSNFDPNLSGWLISARDNGFAEFENVKIRGTLRTSVFEKETVNAVGGQLYIANSTAITGSAVTPSTTNIEVDNVSGFEVGEIIFAKKVTGTGFTKEFMQITGSSRAAEDSDNNYSGFLHVTRAYGMSVTGSAYSNSGKTIQGGGINSTVTSVTVSNNVGLDRRTIRVGDELMAVSSSVGSTTINVRRGVSGTFKTSHSSGATIELLSRDAAIVANVVNPAESYKQGQVLVSTGRFDSGTGNNTTGSGYIHANANPGENVTPYIDFVERTGSGVYDARLRLRLGDLTGLIGSRLGDEVGINNNPGFGLASENVFLSGQIKATSGSIGGIIMESNKLFTSPGVHGGSTTGFFVNSDGDFSLKDKFVFDESSGNLTVNANSFDLSTTSLKINSSNGGTYAMGVTAPTHLSASGIFLSGSGEFNFQQSSSFVRGDSDGIEINFPNFGVTKTGILTATDGNFGGRIEAQTGFFGSASSTGWEIDGNTIKSVVTDATKTGSIEIDATPDSPNITLTSGSFTADIVPEFTLASEILSGGGTTYNGGTFTSGSNSNGVSHTSAVSNGNTSTGKNLFTGYSDATTSTFATSTPTQSPGTNGSNYKSSVAGTARITIATPNIDSTPEGAELFGTFTVQGTLKLFVNNSEVTAATKTFTTTVTPSEFVADSVVVKTVSFSQNHSHTLSGGHNLHWKLENIRVTNNNLREYIVNQSGGDFLGTSEIAANITDFQAFFTDAKHIVSNKKTELAPAGFQAVKLTSTTLASNENFYFRVSPEESKAVDILSPEMHLTGSLILSQNANSQEGRVTLPAGVAPALVVSSSAGNKLGFYSPTRDAIGVYMGNGERFRFSSAGASYVFHSAGDIIGFSGTPSDKRLKENIEPIENSLEKIQKLQGVEFDWKDEYQDKGHDIGFIAQDVESIEGLQPIVKETWNIKTKKDDVKVVSYEKVVPLLVEAIKDQQKQIDELKKKLEVK